MDPELKEYLNKQFKISEIMTAGFTFISIGFAFMLLGVALFFAGEYYSSNIIAGVLAAFVGCILYIMAEPLAERVLKKD